MKIEVVSCIKNLNHLLIFKKSSARPTKHKGNKNKKLTSSKILLAIKLVRINAKPPPLALIIL